MRALIGVSLLVVVVLTVAARGSIHRVRATKGSFVIAEHSLHVGQIRTFSHVGPDDAVACLGRADSISLQVPRPSVGATGSVTWDKRLSLTLGALSHGRVTAHCTAR